MKRLFLGLILSFQVPASSIYLKDVGMMGFASHDLFEWDNKDERNLENGRLDLSSLFDHPEKSWKKGGNPKNAQNAAVWSITKHFVKKHSELLNSGLDSVSARRELTAYYHQMLSESFERFTGLPFPTVGVNQKVTNLEQACMRGMHDILPGKIKLYRPLFKEFDLTNALTAKTLLNQKELDQEIPYYDGKYDEAYLNVKIPFTRKVIDLNKIDGDFIKKFSPWTQEEMLSDLGRAGRGEISLGEVFFIHHLHELFSKGICPQGLMPEVTCH